MSCYGILAYSLLFMCCVNRLLFNTLNDVLLHNDTSFWLPPIGCETSRLGHSFRACFGRYGGGKWLDYETGTVLSFGTILYIKFVFQSEKIHREYQTLQDLNFALEIEHCDHLQDMDSLESQLKKYQYLFNVNEVFSSFCLLCGLIALRLMRVIYLKHFWVSRTRWKSCLSRNDATRRLSPILNRKWA